jgi:hypothetical protein
MNETALDAAWRACASSSMTPRPNPHLEPATRTIWTRCRVTIRNKDIEIMVGRKRKKGLREPNGRVQRVKEIDPKAVAKLQPHRRGVPATLAHDPKAECIMGRLCLNGFLSETQYQAGVKYRTAVMRYRSAIEAPRASEASMAGVLAGPTGGGVAISERPQIEIRNGYMRAFEAIEQAGAARDVAHCAVFDRPPFALEKVQRGLDALALHYGLRRG